MRDNNFSNTIINQLFLIWQYFGKEQNLRTDTIANSVSNSSKSEDIFFRLRLLEDAGGLVEADGFLSQPIRNAMKLLHIMVIQK